MFLHMAWEADSARNKPSNTASHKVKWGSASSWLLHAVENDTAVMTFTAINNDNVKITASVHADYTVEQTQATLEISCNCCRLWSAGTRQTTTAHWLCAAARSLLGVHVYQATPDRALNVIQCIPSRNEMTSAAAVKLASHYQAPDSITSHCWVLMISDQTHRHNTACVQYR